MVAVIAGIFGLILAAVILYLLRRDHLHIGHGVGWALAIVLFSSLGAMPWIVDQLAFGSTGTQLPGVLAASSHN